MLVRGATIAVRLRSGAGALGVRTSTAYMAVAVVMRSHTAAESEAGTTARPVTALSVVVQDVAPSVAQGMSGAKPSLRLHSVPFHANPATPTPKSATHICEEEEKASWRGAVIEDVLVAPATAADAKREGDVAATVATRPGAATHSVFAEPAPPGVAAGINVAHCGACDAAAAGENRGESHRAAVHNARWLSPRFSPAAAASQAPQ